MDVWQSIGIGKADQAPRYKCTLSKKTPPEFKDLDSQLQQELKKKNYVHLAPALKADGVQTLGDLGKQGFDESSMPSTHAMLKEKGGQALARFTKFHIEKQEEHEELLHEKANTNLKKKLLEKSKDCDAYNEHQEKLDVWIAKAETLRRQADA